MLVMGVGYWPLMWMFPPPDPSWSAEHVSIWFQEHRSRILLGAMCCAWSSAWFIQLGVVLWAQIRRVERGVPIWATLALVSSAVGTVTIVLPAILWGVAASAPSGRRRSPRRCM